MSISSIRNSDFLIFCQHDFTAVFVLIRSLYIVCCLAPSHVAFPVTSVLVCLQDVRGDEHVGAKRIAGQVEKQRRLSQDALSRLHADSDREIQSGKHSTVTISFINN